MNEEEKITPPWMAEGETTKVPPTAPPAPSGQPPFLSSEQPVSGSEASLNQPPSSGTTVISTPPPPSPLKMILAGVAILVVVVGLVFVLVNFVLPKIRSAKTVSLTYWGLWEPNEVMTGVLADWEKAHPDIKVNYSRQSIKEYRERLQSALARGEGPDIFRFHITWLPMLKNELETVPAEVYSAQQFEATFYPVAKDSLRLGGGYVGIPLEVDSLALFYNQEIFQAANQTPPTTWDEVRQVACQLTTKDESGKIQTAGIPLGTTGNIEHWSDILGLMMVQNGVDFSNLAGPLAEDALSFYSLFQSSRLCEGIVAGGGAVWDTTLPNSMLAFASGKVAMYLGFSWDVFEIININPRASFRVTAAPQLAGTEVSWASFWVEGVAKKSKNPKEAWEFLKFLSSKEVLQKMYLAQSKIRLFGEPYSRLDMASLLAADPLVSPFVAQAQKAKTWYLSSRTFDNGLNDRMIKYFEDAVNAVNSGKSSKETIQTASSGISQLLSQYGVGSPPVR